MTAPWTAGTRAVSMTSPTGEVLVACAPYGMAGTQEWAANAKLLAAAPLLLAALQEIVPHLFEMSNNGVVTNNTCRRINMAIEAACQP